MVGLAVGTTRFVWDSAYPPVLCGDRVEDDRPSIIKDVHYLHFGILLFSIVFVVTVTISLLTKPIDDKHVSDYQIKSIYFAIFHIKLQTYIV